jgi:hypothetical protein
MSYYGEDGIAPAGIAVLAAVPDKARKEALQQAENIAKSTGKPLKLAHADKDAVLSDLMKLDTTTTNTRSGAMGTDINLNDYDELLRFKEMAEKPGGLKDAEYVEAKALLERYKSVGGRSFSQGAIPNLADGTRSLLEEPRTYFADPRKIPKTEEEFLKAHTLYHGANTKFAEQLEKTKTFKPGAKREAGTGGNFYGLSATTDFRMAKDFSTSVTGEGRVVELYIDPKARVLNMKGKALDDLTEAETRKLAKDFDIIRDFDNVGGENEVRVLNPDVLRDRSQIESAWVLQDTGITDLYKVELPPTKSRVGQG